MAEIALTVTEKVANRTGAHIDERQIAYRVADRESEVAITLAGANRDNPVVIEIGGFCRFTVRDTGAIWRSHNYDQSGAAPDFDHLFDWLSLHKGQPLRLEGQIAR